QIVDNATASIESVAARRADVGFFVQFAEPSNSNMKLLSERKLRTVPVINHELIAAKVADSQVYRVQTFNLGDWGGESHLTTTCTPAAIITGSPESIADPDDANTQRALLDKVKAAPDSAFLPKDNRLSRLISGARNVSSSAVKDMLAAYDVAKKKAEAYTP